MFYYTLSFYYTSNYAEFLNAWIQILFWVHIDDNGNIFYYLTNKIYSMKRQRACQICARLGRTQCGYHQFKNSFSSRKEKFTGEQNIFAQTQSSMHPQQLVQSKYTRNITPTKESHLNVNFNYPQTQSPIRQQIRTSNVVYNHSSNHSRVLFSPQKAQNVQYFSTAERPQIIERREANHIVRIQGGQVLYYPIYPVYQVVYEKVQGSSLAPSRILY